MKVLFALLSVAVFVSSTAQTAEKSAALLKNPMVVMKTSMGQITIELFADKAPVTVKNFLSYVDEKYYDGVAFHRVINNFMIQCGGFEAGKVLKSKKSRATILNEAFNGLQNLRGTLAMARTGDPNSASDQFFINVKDNPSLNPGGVDRTGYAVFGKVIAGMDVVDKIKAVKTGPGEAVVELGGGQEMTTFKGVPLTPVVIESIRRIAGK